MEEYICAMNNLSSDPISTALPNEAIAFLYFFNCMLAYPLKYSSRSFRSVAAIAHSLDAQLWEVTPLDDDLESVFRYLVQP